MSRHVGSLCLFLSLWLLAGFVQKATATLAAAQDGTLESRQDGDEMSIFCKILPRAGRPSKVTTTTITLTTTLISSSTSFSTEIDTTSSGTLVIFESSSLYNTFFETDISTTSTTSTSSSITTTTTTTTSSISGTLTTTTITATATTDVPLNPGPAKRAVLARDTRLVRTLFPRVPLALRDLAFDDAMDACKKHQDLIARRAPATPSCTIVSRTKTPPHLHCGDFGELKNPTTIGTRRYGSAEKGFETCRDTCVASIDCISFEFHQDNFLCKFFGTTLNAQGYRHRRSNTNVVLYNRACFKSLCSVTTTATTTTETLFRSFVTVTTTVLETTTTSTSIRTIPTTSKTTTTTTGTTTTSTTSTSSVTTTTTTTGPTTTVTSTSQAAPTVVNYNLVWGPQPSNCAYNRYYRAVPNVSGDPGPDNRFSTGLAQCEHACTQDSRCKMFFYDAYDPAKTNGGFAGGECDLDDQPLQNNLVQCSLPIRYGVGYNKVDHKFCSNHWSAGLSLERSAEFEIAVGNKRSGKHK